MSNFLDFSPYTYIEDFERDNTLNIGWIDSSCQYKTGSPIENILMILWQFCLISVVQTRGVYECDLCSSVGTVIEERNGVSLALGSAEIRVFGGGGSIFAAPNLIYHYVKEHQYKLPEKFELALLNGPNPPSEEYFKKLKNLELSWSETLKGDSDEKVFSLF